MKRVVWLALLAGAVWSACARPRPEQHVVADTATALAMKGEGISYSIGSDLTIDTDSRIYKVSDFKRLLDAAEGPARTAHIRTPTTPNDNRQAPATQLQGVEALSRATRTPAGRKLQVDDMAPIHGEQTPFSLLVENTIATTHLLSAPSRRRGAASGRGTGSE
jgi:hypothetical protein